MTLLQDFVLETVSNPGVGDFILSGAPQNRLSFAQAFPSGGRVYYFADDGTQAEWGVGTLTLGPPATLARTTILGNTYGNTGILRFVGLVQVYNEVPARFLPLLDEAGGLTLKGLKVTDDALVPAVQDWTSRQAVGAADAEGRYVTKTVTEGNAPIINIQLLNANDADGPSATLQVQTSWGSLQIPTTANVAALLSALSRSTTDGLGQKVGGLASDGNLAVSNMQLINAPQGDTDSALIMIDVAWGKIVIPSNTNVNGQIRNYAQPKGSYQPSGDYALRSELSMGTWAKHINFNTRASNGDRVNFPEGFSGTPTVLVQSSDPNDTNCHAYSSDQGGFYLHINGGGTSNIQVMADGPK